VLRRLAPFDMRLHYTDRHRLPAEVEQELNLTFHPSIQDMMPHCDVVTINAPLHHETRNLFDDNLLASMRRGAYPSNTARALIVDPRRRRTGTGERAARGLRRRRLVASASAGRPPLADDAPPRHDPHISGSTLSAQARYTAGTREILESHFAGTAICDEYLIVDGGRLAGAGEHSYSARS